MITLSRIRRDFADLRSSMTPKDHATLARYITGLYAQWNGPLTDIQYEIWMDSFFDAWRAKHTVMGVKLHGPKRPRQKVYTVKVEPVLVQKMVEVIEARLAAATPEQVSTWADDEVIACEEAPAVDEWVDDLDLTGCEDDDTCLETGWFAAPAFIPGACPSPLARMIERYTRPLPRYAMFV